MALQSEKMSVVPIPNAHTLVCQDGVLADAKVKEQRWLHHACELLDKNEVNKNDTVS